MSKKNELNFKAGYPCIKTGQYDIVNSDGEVLFSKITVLQGQPFPKTPRRNQSYKLSRDAAVIVTILMAYLIIVLLFSLWLLLDIWARNFTVIRMLGIDLGVLKKVIENNEILEEAEQLIRTIGFSIIGGMIGSIIYNIRMLHKYYAKEKTFDPDWFWKYISSPWEGAGLSLIVLSLIRGGVTVFGGSTGTEVDAVTNFAAFGVGSLVGFGMRDVIGWMSGLIQTMFTIQKHDDKPSSTEQTAKKIAEDNPSQPSK